MKIASYSPLLNRGKPLIEEIRAVKNPTVETIKEQYGEFGVDLFMGKTPSLIKKRAKTKNPIINLYNKIKDYFSQKAEYEDGDTMFRIVHKYIFNEKAGLNKDIENKFGMETLYGMELMGYVK